MVELIASWLSFAGRNPHVFYLDEVCISTKDSQTESCTPRAHSTCVRHSPKINCVYLLLCSPFQEAYERLTFREALKAAAYDMGNARDAYRLSCGPDGMNKGLVERYIKVLQCSSHLPVIGFRTELMWPSAPSIHCKHPAEMLAVALHAQQ